MQWFSRFVSIWFNHFLSIPPFVLIFLFFLFAFFLVDMPAGFKMFGQPALFHIPPANVAEYFLLIIIYCVTLFLFVQAFNTHSIHSSELVTISIFLTLCALSTLHTIIRYYFYKCISLYHKDSSIFPKNHHRFHLTVLFSFPSLYLYLLLFCVSAKRYCVWKLCQCNCQHTPLYFGCWWRALCLEIVWHHLRLLQSNEGFHRRKLYIILFKI